MEKIRVEGKKELNPINYQHEKDDKKCPNCRTELPEGAKYCPNCGFALENSELKTVEITMGKDKWREIEIKIDEHRKFRDYRNDPLAKKIERLLITFLYDGRI